MGPSLTLYGGPAAYRCRASFLTAPHLHKGYSKKFPPFTWPRCARSFQIYILSNFMDKICNEITNILSIQLNYGPTGDEETNPFSHSRRFPFFRVSCAEELTNRLGNSIKTDILQSVYSFHLPRSVECNYGKPKKALACRGFLHIRQSPFV